MAVKKHLGLDTDTTLGGSSASDGVIPSQKAVKAYVDNASFGSDYVTKTGNNTISGNNTHSGNNTFSGENTFTNNVTKFNKEVIVTAASPYGQFRAIGGNYGIFLRNDGSNVYFLLTDSGDQYGTYNSLRPLTIKCSNGIVLTTPNDTTHGIVTTEGITKGSNGYVKLGNGVIIQWGRWTNSSDPAITFPTSFTSTNYSITTNDERTENNAYANTYTSKSKTGVTIHAQMQKGNWIAIGY